MRLVSRFNVFLIFTCVLMLNSSLAHSAFVLDSTRYIYNEKNKSVDVSIKNNTEKLFGGQVWIESKNESEESGFVAIPSFFKLEGNKSQLVRVLNVGEGRPQDRESIYFFNVQEIPTKGDAGNSISFALNTKVKLFYRPALLEGKREKAEEKISYKLGSNNQLVFINQSPFYFAIVGLVINGNEVELKEHDVSKLAQFAPFSEINVLDNYLNQNKLKNGLESIKLKSINDFGGVDLYEVQAF